VCGSLAARRIRQRRRSLRGERAPSAAAKCQANTGKAFWTRLLEEDFQDERLPAEVLGKLAQGEPRAVIEARRAVLSARLAH
jgi:hypothetical protein